MRARRPLFVGIVVTGVLSSLAVPGTVVHGTSPEPSAPEGSAPAELSQIAQNVADAEEAFVVGPGGLDGEPIQPADIQQITSVQVPAGSVAPGSESRSVAVICVAPSEGCTRAQEFQVSVFQSFGWQAEVVPADGTPEGWQSAFDTAIAQGVDAISAISISPAAVSAQLEQARDLGIFTVDAAQSEELDGPGYDAYIDFRHALMKQLLAQWVLVNHDGPANIVNVTLVGIPDLDVANVGALVQQTCPDCTYESVEMTLTDATDPVKTGNRISAILNANPDLTHIIWPTDNVGFDATLEAIRAAGKEDSVQLLTGDANPPGMSAVQSGAIPVYGLIPYEWALGLAPVDAVLRLVNGGAAPDDSTAYGIGVHLVTPESAPTGEITYETICQYSLDYVDWIGPYEAAWGVEIPPPC